MFANQTSQRRPSGAPIHPGQGAAGVDQDSQQQMAEAYHAQLNSVPHLSPLHGVGNNPLQHDDPFAGSQGFPTPSPDLGHLQRFPTPSSDLSRQGFPTPSPDLRRQGPYMFGGGQQQTPALLSMRSGGQGCSPEEYQQHYLFRQQQIAPQMNQGPYQRGSPHDEQLQNLNSMVAKLVSEVAMLSESNKQILLVNAQHSVANDALASQMKILADEVQTLKTDISESQTKSQKKSSKNISNDHPALKVSTYKDIT